MIESLETPVLIIGAGPVGLTLALDLASRGIDAIIVEQRAEEAAATPRANHVSARAMETYRRLGVAQAIRQAGLPGDFLPDIVWKTTMTGYELTRIALQSRDEVTAPGFADPAWPTPEPQHKINQMYLEPILRRAAARQSRLELRYRTRFDRYEQDIDGVRVFLTDLATGDAIDVRARWMIGCDGGTSSVRKAIGAVFEGDPALTRVVSLHVRAPDLLARLRPRPAHRYYLINRRQAGSVVTLDGAELWSFHVMLPSADSDPAELDPAQAIGTMTGLNDLDYTIFATDSWTGRRLLADRFRAGNVFLCGDAAHIWVPNAGYGMNAGIADAENLAWRIAAVLEGWGGAQMLDGYARERHPITDQVSNFAKALALGNRSARFRTPPAELEQSGVAADAVRLEYGAALQALNWPQFNPIGLNFGYFYDDSPTIVYDGEAAPEYDLATYVPSTAPGCRAPHFFFADGSALYDRLGNGYTLLCLDQSVDATPLVAMAQSRGVPLEILQARRAEADPAYRTVLTLIRPDRHVAWRGDALPADVAALTGRIAGDD